MTELGDTHLKDCMCGQCRPELHKGGLMKEKCEEKSIFLTSVVSILPWQRSFSNEYKILKVDRETKRDKACLTIEVPDTLADGIIKNMQGSFFVPIRGLTLHWVECKKEAQDEQG